MKSKHLACLVLSFLLAAVTAGAQSPRPFVGLFSHTSGPPSATTVAANFDANPYLAGITIKVGWSTIQPTDAVTFNWSGIGDVLTVAGERGKQVHLAIIPGFTTPAWVYAAPHNVPFLNDLNVSGVVGDAPIPWNPTYVALFDALIDSFADYLATHPHKSALKAIEVMGNHYRGEEMHAPSVATFTAQGFTITYNDVYANWQHWINRWAQKFPEQDLILVISQTYTGAGADGSDLAPLLNNISQYFVDALHPSRRAILQTDQLDGRKSSVSGTTNQRCIFFNSGAYAGDNGVPNGHEMVGNFRTQPYRQGRPAMTVFNFKAMLHPHYMQIWSGNINDLWVSRDLLKEWYRYRNNTPAEVQADLTTRGLYLATSFYSTGSTAPQADDTLNVTANGTPVVITLSYDDTLGTLPDASSDFRITQPPSFGTLGAISFSGGVATVTYTPASSNVIDTFRWEVTDTTPSDFTNNAQRSNFAIATVEVGTVPHGPLFSLDPIVSAGLNPPVPPASAGAVYNGTLAGRATDADSGTTLSYGKDSGPAWLNVAADGTLSGTPGLSDAGENRWIVSVADNTGRTGYATLVMQVAAALVLGGGEPPAPVSGVSYSHTFTVTGATGAVTWTLAGGTLPPGLTLSSDGVLSGTPTTPGSFVFTVQATDSLGLTGTQSVTLTVSSGPQTVASLAVLHTNGQTYLTWSEVADSAATYRVYRSTTPFTSTALLNSTNLVGTAEADSSFDERLSALRSTNFFYRITAAGPDLTDTQGLFVHTPTADGAAYYAVMAVSGGLEQLALNAGQNTTAVVNETVTMPEPVFQRNVTVNSRTVEVYAHWVSATATPFYPAMGNENSVAHHFGLVRKGKAATHSLIVRPHVRHGSFLSFFFDTNDPDQWVLTLDDWMPNSIENTFWYGYHETFDIDTGGPQGTSGIVHDYTTRRAVWEVEWALRTLPLDLNRIYMTGQSMGGVGSDFLSLMMPGKIAATWTVSTKYDFSFLTDPNPENNWNDGADERATSGDIMWGTVATNLMSSEGIPVYDRLNAGYLVEAFRGVDQPVMIAFHGKNDDVVGWAEKLGFYNAINANRHGGMFFFDSGVHNRVGGEWVTQQSVNVLNRYRLNQSYPAFSNSSANGNPGNGNATDGDTFGTINGNLDWDTSSIVDTASQWQIRLLTVALTSTGGTVAAPASATADVTPRRLQAFPHAASRVALYEVRDAENALLKQGLVVADADGLYTIPAVPVNPSGTTLTLSTIEQSSPAITIDSNGFTLTWPTTVGLCYQVEWSSDLDQWFSIGTPTLAVTTSMSWTDDGSQTGMPPIGSGKRFYRLRISIP